MNDGDWNDDWSVGKSRTHEHDREFGNNSFEEGTVGTKRQGDCATFFASAEMARAPSWGALAVASRPPPPTSANL